MVIYTAPRKSPTGVRYSELQSQQFTLHWEPLPTDERAGPSVTYYVDVREGSQTMTQATNSTSQVIQDLSPNTLYNITVKACTNYPNLCGPSSPAIQIQTLEKGMSSFTSLLNRDINQKFVQLLQVSTT